MGANTLNDMSAPSAIHILGGNRLDDIRIDFVESFKLQDEWLQQVPKKLVAENTVTNTLFRLHYLFLKRLGLWDPMVMSGFICGWFNEFQEYWSNCLGGRPISIMDFHGLMLHYRKAFHGLTNLSWSSADQHIRNYQSSENLFCLMSLILRDALMPLRAPAVTDTITSAMTILEFGCCHAPVYRSWRLFLNHKSCKWFLADIPNYGFHYARHIYGRDDKVRFVTIDGDHFDEPMKGINDRFDIIIVQEVFEHLQKPRLIAEYLVDRLKPKGVFAFDYIESDAKGLDTPTGLGEREETLSFLNEMLAPFGISESEGKEQSGLRLRVKRR